MLSARGGSPRRVVPVYAYEPELRRRPDQFVRGRTWPRTIVFLVLAAASVAGLAYQAVNYSDLAEQAADAEGSARFVAGQRLGLPVSIVLLPLLTIALLVAAVRWGRVWLRAETGTRLRRRHYRGVCGGRPVFDDVVARLRTRDPSAFLPLPPPPADGRALTDVEIELWTADDDRVGLATVVLRGGPGNKPLTFSEPIAFDGPAYGSLTSALKQGLDTPPRQP
jgi:hypothetical protein